MAAKEIIAGVVIVVSGLSLVLVARNPTVLVPLLPSSQQVYTGQLTGNTYEVPPRPRPYERMSFDDSWCDRSAATKASDGAELSESGKAAGPEQSKKVFEITPMVAHSSCLDAYYFDQLEFDTSPQTVLVTKEFVLTGFDVGGFALSNRELSTWQFIEPPVSNPGNGQLGAAWVDNGEIYTEFEDVSEANYLQGTKVYKFSPVSRTFTANQSFSQPSVQCHHQTIIQRGETLQAQTEAAPRTPLKVLPTDSFEAITLADSNESFCKKLDEIFPNYRADLRWSTWQVSGDELWFTLDGDYQSQGDVGGGVVRYNYKTNEMQLYRKENGLAASRSCAVTADDKEVWVAHCTEGVFDLSRLDRITGKWNLVSASKNGVAMEAHKLLLDGKYLWLGGFSNTSLVKYDRETGQATKLGEPQGTIDSYVSTLRRTNDAIWVTYHYTNPIGWKLRRPIPLTRIRR